MNYNLLCNCMHYYDSTVKGKYYLSRHLSTYWPSYSRLSDSPVCILSKLYLTIHIYIGKNSWGL